MGSLMLRDYQRNGAGLCNKANCWLKRAPRDSGCSGLPWAGVEPKLNNRVAARETFI